MPRADGLILEVYVDPEQAWSDGKQTITPAALERIIKACKDLRDLLQSS